MMRALCLIFLMLLILPQETRAATLNIELADSTIDITTGFNGAEVVVFGVTDAANPAVVVTMRGPEKTVIVRRKGRILGAYMNRASMEFRRVPSYYDYAQSSLSPQTIPPALLEENGIGLQNLDFYPENPTEDTQDNAYFRDALIRRFQQRDFYPIKPASVQFMQPQFFKTVFPLPPGVPTGNYTIDAYMIQDGQVSARETRSFQVGQVGFNARVYIVATQNSAVYAVVIIALAVLSGWAAFTFLRRD